MLSGVTRWWMRKGTQLFLGFIPLLYAHIRHALTQFKVLSQLHFSKAKLGRIFPDPSLPPTCVWGPSAHPVLGLVSRLLAVELHLLLELLFSVYPPV